MLVLKERKGIILAGGMGTRLSPITNAVSKQLLPIYDKPMIYYPLSTLISAGIRDILIITKPEDKVIFQRLLRDGNQLGLNISYATQNIPKGLAEAFIIGSKFIDGHPVVLILGDNLFQGESLKTHFANADKKKRGATIFGYSVKDPERYGVVEFDAKGKVIKIKEKPKNPRSNFAVTGIYFYDETVLDKALSIKPSSRGELEITDLNLLYMDEGNLDVELLGRGIAWLDTGNFDSFLEASNFIKTLESRQGLKIGCPEELVWRMGHINDEQLRSLAQPLIKSGYGRYLLNLIELENINSL